MPMALIPRSTLLVLVLLIATILAPALPLASQTPTPVSEEIADQLEAIEPAMRDTIRPVLEDGLPRYTMDVALSEADGGGVVRGSLSVVWTNRTGGTIDALPFRMFANDPEPVVTITSATVDGEAVEPDLSVVASVATLALPKPLDEGKATTVELEFESVAPLGGDVHYGMLGVDPEEGTWSLAHWYPIAAVWDKGGWMLDPPSVNGDPVFSETATYDITMTAPADLVIVGSGVEIEGDDDGTTQTRRFVTGPARDAVYAIDGDFEVTEIEVGDTTVRSWYLPAEAENGAAIAGYAANALAFYEEALGPYPFRELELASVQVYGALGVEYPQFIAMARKYYTEAMELDAPNAMEFTTVHEVAHMWFYFMVGNNQYQHAFIDEGLANQLSGDLYMRETYGEREGSKLADTYIGNRYRQGVGTEEDKQVVDSPTDDFPSSNRYVYAMYYKGAWGFRALEMAIGTDAYIAGLQLYVERFSWRIATPGDLRACLEEASGEDLGELWAFWFESDAGSAG
jgi:TPR repeat protein